MFPVAAEEGAAPKCVSIFHIKGFSESSSRMARERPPGATPINNKKKNHPEITFISSEITAVISEITPKTPTYVVKRNKKLSIMLSIILRAREAGTMTCA